MVLAFTTVASPLFAEDQIAVTVASQKPASHDGSSWEEPNLFSPEDARQTANTPQVRKAKRAEEPASGDESPVTDGVQGTNASGVASEFPKNYDEFGNQQSAVGLAASRDRDAALARILSTPETQPYNIKIGRIPFTIGAGMTIDFSDNIRRTSRAKESELTLLPRMDISGSVKLAPNTTLTLGFGLGYIKYLNNSDEDRLIATAGLTPDTGLSLDVKVGKFLVTVYDRPSVPQFQADAATQRNQSQYSQFSNAAGLSVMWNVNSKTEMSVRYSHTNYISLKSEASNTDGATDSFLASLSYQLSESLGVGLEAGQETRTYDGSFLNNGATYHAGAFATFQLSRFLRVQGSVGYQGGEYDSGGAVGDSSNLGTYYASVSFSNNLNSHVSHSLSIGREAQQGAFSNFTISNYVRYQINLDLIRGVGMGAWASFEDTEESGGLFASHFQNYTFGASCSLSLTKRINLTLAYTFAKRVATDGPETQSDFLDYAENRVSLRIGYAF